MANVLIIDDSTVQRVIIKKFVENENHTVVGEAGTGQEGVKLYKMLRPDIVTLDIVMADANGISILEEIINFDKNANIIMCSSTAIQHVIIESIKLGAKNFLVKPFDRNILINAINKILSTQNRVSVNKVPKINNNQ